MRPTVYLFDVDGTLINAGGAGRRAIERAFAAHVGPGDHLAGFSFQGLTDPLIVRLGLERAGRRWDATLVDAILATYLDVLAEEMPRAQGFRVHAGVEAVLDALERRPAAAVGLGTGNVRAGARLKLARGGLDARFPFGGFGCDAEDRAALLRVGAARGAERLGVPVDACRVVVIGDTPRDVAAAAAIGAACIAVCTSGSDAATLQAAGACRALAALDAPDVLAALDA